MRGGRGTEGEEAQTSLGSLQDKGFGAFAFLFFRLVYSSSLTAVGTEDGAPPGKMNGLEDNPPITSRAMGLLDCLLIEDKGKKNKSFNSGTRMTFIEYRLYQHAIL